MLRLIAAATIALATLTGCAQSRVVVRKSLVLDGDGAATQEGIKVILTVFNEEALAKDKGSKREFQFTRAGAAEKTTRALFRAPLFIVTIQNESGQVVPLGDMVATLTDSSGNALKEASSGESMEWLIRQANREGFSVPAYMEPIIRGAYADFNYLGSAAIKLAPGTKSGFLLSFRIPGGDDEAARSRWLEAQKSIRVKLFNVPVRVDSAGSISKRSTFEFAVASKAFRVTEQLGIFGYQEVSREPVNEAPAPE